MPRGPRWSPSEIKLLQEMSEKGMSSDDIFKSGKLPRRTHGAIRMQIQRLGSIVGQRDSIVEQIREAEIVGIETFVRHYVDAFKKICSLTEYDKTDLERFRLIFMAAWKYREVFAAYERVRQIEEGMEEIRKRLEILEAQAKIQSESG